MSKGFTLLELVVVIIILGILATLGLTQYFAMVERSRGSEAKAVLGDMRTLAAAARMEYGDLNAGALTDERMNLGAGGGDTIPNACAPTHYFFYAYAATGANTVTLTATRCGTGDGGKTPDSSTVGGQTLVLNVDFLGQDTWGGTGPWE